MRWLVFALGLLFCATSASAQSTDFATWLQAMRQDALSQGISGDTFDKAFVKDMVSDHQADVKEFSKQASKSDAAGAFAKETLPTLHNNGAVFTARVQAKVRAIVPRIVRDEVARSLGAFFASSRGPGRPRKVLS